MSTTSSTSLDSKVHGGLSYQGAVINMLKSMIGLGVLSLPYATSQVGWLPSVVGTGAIAFVTLWGIFFAAMARLELEAGDEEDQELVTKAAEAPGGARRYEPVDTGLGFFDRVCGRVFGLPGQAFCAFTIALGQIATGIVYVDVICENIQSYFPGNDAKVPIILVVGSVLSVLCIVADNMGDVTLLSAISLAIYGFILAGLVTETVYSVEEHTEGAGTAAIAAAGNYGSWFGVSIFAFGGFGIFMVVYDEMKDPRDFYRASSCSYFITWAFYTVFALLGYFCFGADTDELIYFNFRRGSFFRAGASAFISAILSASFVLMMFPVFTCAQRLGPGLPGIRNIHHRVMRLIIVGLTVFIAYLLPNVVFVIDKLGTIAAVFSSFVLPVVCYLQVSHRPLASEYLLGAIVVVVGVFGTVLALM